MGDDNGVIDRFEKLETEVKELKAKLETLSGNWETVWLLLNPRVNRLEKFVANLKEVMSNENI